MILIFQSNIQTSLLVNLLYYSLISSTRKYVLFLDPKININNTINKRDRIFNLPLEEFDMTLLKDSEDIEVIAQSGDWEITLANDFIQSILSYYPLIRINLSFYSDGVMNTFFNTKTISDNTSELYSNFCKLKSLYYFGDVHDFYPEFNDIDKKKISYTHINHLSVDTISDVVIDDFINSDVIFVPLRLWGSETFHNGKYKFKRDLLDAADVIYKLIIEYYKILNTEIPVFIRADSRDLELSYKIIDTFRSTYKINLIKDRFSEDILIEQILIYIKNHSCNKNMMINFDSSAAIHSCHAGLIDSALIGCDLSIIKSVAHNSIVYEYIKSNIDIYYNIINNSCILYKTENIKDGLFIANLIHQ